MPPTRKFPAALGALAVASLLFAACGDDGGGGEDVGAGADGSAETGGIDGITVEGGFGEDPTITIDDGYEAPDELVTEDIVVGDGEEVPEGATVTVHYEGVLLDGTEFDGSFARGETATFPLDGVIPGWTEGIPGMQVGGRRLLVIPSELAYGADGRSGIPPDAPLVFVVDLVEVG